jgi:hypothetical protein
MRVQQLRQLGDVRRHAAGCDRPVWSKKGAVSQRLFKKTHYTVKVVADSYVLGRLLRTKEKYITAKAASNTPPNIRIKVVTIVQSTSAGP